MVIDRRQFLFLAARRDREKPHIANATLKKLEYFYQSGNKKVIKDLLITLAADWEKRQTPQLHVFHMVQQLVYTLLPSRASLASQHDAILREINDLFAYAASYGKLMAGVYSLLFDDDLSRDKKLSPQELYAYAIRFIQEKFAEPISIMHVCGEIGISQTYLSRLFRKYGNTSFNAFLTQYRMESAMRLIREHPDILLRDVAACVGYDDSSYFSKVFHQATGHTPSQWAAELDGAPQGDGRRGAADEAP